MKIFLCGRYGSVAIAGAAMLACGVGHNSERSSSRRDCVHLRDQLVALRLATVTADYAAHKANFERAFDRSFLDECVAHVSRADVSCALAAHDGASVAACLAR